MFPNIGLQYIKDLKVYINIVILSIGNEKQIQIGGWCGDPNLKECGIGLLGSVARDTLTTFGAFAAVDISYAFGRTAVESE